MESVVIFGGTGFIGAFFANFILQNTKINKVYLFDLEPITEKKSSFRKRLLLDPRLIFVKGDIRNPIWWQPAEKISLIANFAAVHREPGHVDREYYETNLLGAENVCAWAERSGCNQIIFTSSISPYGPSEDVKDERSLPIPATAYGGSKLAAEKIHQIWQARNATQRRLVIARPGVVFGPGEGGNVSRLIKAVLNRYFFYMGNRETRKAGVYVKELCNAMWWVLQQQEAKGEYVSLFNMSMNPGPSIEEYVNTVCKVACVKRTIPGVPFRLLATAAYIIEAVAKPLGINHPFSPVRIRKLVRSNNILPAYLVENGYPYMYTLESAFADWKQNCPEEWK
ncbi:nucleoside-diphosphate-sugar epimerase [Pseudomonas sp. GM33]|uniref:NAD-dependent epimerase/dehydratase family protein n=1 Tax=Pseudomonas sp. GM33 TaxID=1144329 RepID=UPI0002704CDB|nr:NAD(P)-dependent oxidoreductase [Pseudomonas sp. GM33]EJM43522.1 nucleoside-diphosphate-sugar epimerase [Pseudomonas sp. GM33]